MLAPNLTGSPILEYIFIYRSDESYLSPSACTKHTVTFSVEMKCIMKKQNTVHIIVTPRL